ncbi:DEAD/DEAH box helicase [Skermania piniformis]|uniref:DEAD/DEAH box helicase n=1 Tax=Skermania pinensis TaxID=39122 RepID=A0ABX8SCL0_9ACTN|nr:DEAD/DEAH box helicase [Skermania piniformis]QXQ14719.1 DEAD/DEAH box helicase [Skermania piniformis]
MLHGIWSPGAGLLLWRAEPAGPPAPEPFAAIVATARFRRTLTVPVPVPHQVRAHALAPETAAAALRAVRPDAVDGLAGDLRYLVHVTRGIERWVRAGRVVPEVYRADGAWWTRWRLVGGESQRAWLAELAAALPPVQRAQEAGALTDFVAEITDPLVRSTIAGAPNSAHPLVRGLTTDAPLASGTHAVARTLDEWRAGLTVDEPELVLRLGEPDLGEPDLGEPDVATGSGDDAALWRLEVCLRPAGEAPQPVPIRLADPERLRLALRKLGAAMAAYPRLRDVPSDPASLDLLLPPEVVLDLVEHGAKSLQDSGIQLLLPRAWEIAEPTLRLRVQAPPVVRVADSVVGMAELVSYDWELALGDTVLTPDELRRLAAAQGDLVRLRGSWVRADHRALARAARYLAGHAGHDAPLGELLGELVAGRPPVPIAAIAATGWVAALLDPATEPESVPSPPGLCAELRPYQRRGLDWLATMSRLGLGAVLADDMGLGKTVQVLALLGHERATPTSAAPGRAAAATLLVCPMSVVGNWQREAARFLPDLRVHVHHGPGRLAGDALAAAVVAADLVITTYALVARDAPALRELEWDRIVLDEAQHVKNAGTAQARAVRSIPARHRLALTGTPVENRLEELRSILDFANPNLLGSAQSFRARFAVPIERDRDDDVAARLRTVTRPFVLRRVKTDPAVIADLPEKFEMTVRANLTAEQAALYRAVVDDMLAKIADAEGIGRKGAVLAALTRLKQVCNHPAHFLGDGSALLRRGRHRSGKLALVEDVLEAVLADDEKALLFTQFREFGDLVAPYLRERFGTRVPFLHGGVGKSTRDRMVTEFQNDAGPPLMVLSLKAGGTGLNLTAANHVVHLDRWWNPAVENQATDRAFRIGQQRNVQVRKLVCVGTVEERIDAMLAGKQELADLVVGAGEGWITELGTAELAELLRLGDEAVGE